jgi:glycosyltransferase involved in cell wall biosynthesis
MKTIVSVTPLAVEADSRTYKEAASFARLGYRSIVVEGRRSALPRERLPFELRPLASPEPASDPGPVEAAQPLVRRRGVAWELFRAGAWIYSALREVRRVRRVLPPASLYVVHEFEQFLGVYSRARQLGVPFVYDAHDLYSALVSEQVTDPGFSRSVAILRNFVERLCVLAASARVTVAPRLAQLQERRFGRPFFVVRNASDPRLEEESTSSVRAMVGVGPDEFLIVMIGNAKPSMAFEQTLEVIGRLPDNVHLACVGRGYERHRDEVTRRGLNGRVSFVGAVPPTQVASFLRDADLAAVLYAPTNISVFNALPNGFFQAIAAGLPMVYARLPEMDAVAREHAFGVPVDLSDLEEVTREVRLLSEDRKVLAALRTDVVRASRELTWEAEEPSLASIIEAIVGPAQG